MRLQYKKLKRSYVSEVALNRNHGELIAIAMYLVLSSDWRSSWVPAILRLPEERQHLLM